jgi:hypothetical protein
MKKYYVSEKYVINAERYLDKLKFKLEIDVPELFKCDLYDKAIELERYLTSKIAEVEQVISNCIDGREYKGYWEDVIRLKSYSNYVSHLE